MSFNPFESRLCRDIRNKLAHGFVQSILKNDRCMFQNEIQPYQSKNIKAYHTTYICHRVNCLEKVFDQMAAQGIKSTDDRLISVILWNLGLFFECHEWLENQWLTAHGNHKKALQALILAAVVYEQLEYDRQAAAKKVAAKAIPLFNEYREMIPKPFDVDTFVLKLTRIDPVWPRFNLCHIK